MSRAPSRIARVERRPAVRRRRWMLPLALVSPWLMVSAFALLNMSAAHGLIFAGLAATALVLTVSLLKWAEERRWARPIRLLAARMEEHGGNSEVTHGLDEVPELAELSRAFKEL